MGTEEMVFCFIVKEKNGSYEIGDGQAMEIKYAKAMMAEAELPLIIHLCVDNGTGKESDVVGRMQELRNYDAMDALNNLANVARLQGLRKGGNQPIDRHIAVPDQGLVVATQPTSRFGDLMPPTMNYEWHQHPLTLTNLPNLRGQINCDVCGQRSSDVIIYRCGVCAFNAHPHCVGVGAPQQYQNEEEEEIEKLPSRGGAPSSVKTKKHTHELLLDFKSQYNCGICRKSGEEFVYRCEPCSYFVHPQCVGVTGSVQARADTTAIKKVQDRRARETPSFVHDISHQHKLVLDYRNHYTCDICDRSGKDNVYRCEPCSYFAHPQCVGVPCSVQARGDSTVAKQKPSKPASASSAQATKPAAASSAQATKPAAASSAQATKPAPASSAQATKPVRSDNNSRQPPSRPGTSGNSAVRSIPPGAPRSTLTNLNVHPHPLVLPLSVKRGLYKYTCGVCRRSGDGPGYSCESCPFEAHAECVAALPSLPLPYR
eukprot:gene396-416_t